VGTIILNNRTTFIRCPKNTEHPFTRVPAKLFSLNGYQLAIMTHILSNKDGWNLVKYEIGKRLAFPRNKFNGAWKSLEDLGYIKKTRVQGGWDYTIIEDLDFTLTTISNCEESTLTTGAQCKDGILTTINNNYNYNITEVTDTTCYDDQFNELVELYPVSSTWPDGKIVPLTKNLSKCKILYTELLSTKKVIHTDILECLKVELVERERTGNKQYQPALLKWITEAGWEVYKSKTLQPVYAPYGSELE
jgi:hypothetical protein